MYMYEPGWLDRKKPTLQLQPATFAATVSARVGCVLLNKTQRTRPLILVVSLLTH